MLEKKVAVLCTYLLLFLLFISTSGMCMQSTAPLMLSSTSTRLEQLATGNKEQYTLELYITCAQMIPTRNEWLKRKPLISSAQLPKRGPYASNIQMTNFLVGGQYFSLWDPRDTDSKHETARRQWIINHLREVTYQVQLEAFGNEALIKEENRFVQEREEMVNEFVAKLDTIKKERELQQLASQRKSAE